MKTKSANQSLLTIVVDMTRLLIALVVASISSSCSGSCDSDIKLEIQDHVDSQTHHMTLRGVVRYGEDAFLIAMANQTLPKLCVNSVMIENELTVLHINNVSLVDIEPGAFQIAPTLAILKISHNPLNTLKEGMFNNINVKELDLTHNYIVTIHNDTFDNMTKLEVVRLSHNAIKDINPVWFQGSPNVYKLSIIYNELTSIPGSAFKNMASNRGLRLRLSANQITNIHADAFANAGDIDILWMNGNKIRELPDSLFLNRTIKRLEVNTNKLLCFPELLYQSKVRSLAFVDNPYFRCLCLQKVRHFVESNHVDIWYPAIICEDRKREVNVVFNFNKTYELPILPPPSDQT